MGNFYPFLHDEQGQDLFEYSLLIAAIIVASAAVLAADKGNMHRSVRPATPYSTPSLGISLLLDMITPLVVSGIYRLLALRWTPGVGTLTEGEKNWINKLALVVLTVSFVGMFGMTLYARVFE